MRSMSVGFEFLDHPADVWVHAWGSSLAQVYEQCALALMQTMIGSSIIEENEIREITIEESDRGSLLVAFLSEFLYLFDANRFIFASISVDQLEKSSNGFWKIHAIMKGERFSRSKHFVGTEVKAITYSYLDIQESDKRFDIKIIYDI
jgi:SHS2 domain-containing protein